MARDVLIPDPLSSDQQYARFYHLDLTDLEDSELQDELWAIQPLLWGLPPDNWFRERVTRLEDELKRRQTNTSYNSNRRQKPKPAEGVKL